jgi:hypothetical protein
MSITFKVDPSKHLSTFIVTGKISSNEIIGTIESFYKKKFNNNVLWDFRYANVNLTFSNELENIANSFFRSNWKFQNIGKTAIVGSADLWFSIAKMYAKFIKISDLSNKIQVFRFMDEAIKWLGSKN